MENLANGAAVSQIVQMFNWWKRVGTPKGVSVPQFSIAGASAQLLRISDVASTGEVADLIASAPGTKIYVTGSSLGGHLAMAFASLFGDQIEHAVAFNAPGFGSSEALVNLFTPW